MILIKIEEHGTDYAWITVDSTIAVFENEEQLDHPKLPIFR
jgi:hypothetical protein